MPSPPFKSFNQSNSMVFQVDRLVLAMCLAKVDHAWKDKHAYHLVVYTDCVFVFLSHVVSVCARASAWGKRASRSLYRLFPLESCVMCRKDQTTGDKRRCPKREFRSCTYCSCPRRTDFLDERHKFVEANGIFNVAKGVRNAFGKGNATAKQAIGVKLAR